ncbi:MAG: hypothetical protein RL748_640, partial [Pseudomonadota bacterium]
MKKITLIVVLLIAALVFVTSFLFNWKIIQPGYTGIKV